MILINSNPRSINCFVDSILDFIVPAIVFITLILRFFDKFTGDGAIFFLALPDLRDAYKLPDESYKNEWVKNLKEAVEYCEKIMIKFLKTTLPEIRKACGTQPCHFGLSIGIDVGECLVTDMQPSEKYNHYKKSNNWFYFHLNVINKAKNKK